MPPACACFIPACRRCFPQRSAAPAPAASACQCFLPGCATCGHMQAEWAELAQRCPPKRRKAASCCCFLPWCQQCVHKQDEQPEQPERRKRRVAQDVQQANTAATFPFDHAQYVGKLLQSLRPSWSALQEVGRPRDEVWLYWELFSGHSHLTECLRSAGAVCGPPVDLVDRVGGLRLDLSLAASKSLVLQLVREARPRWIHSGFPCTFWIQLGRATAKRTEAQWQQLHREHIGYLELSAHLMMCQHDRKRAGSLEQPHLAGFWDTVYWSALLQRGWKRFSFHSCAWQLQDEFCRPLKKPGAVASNRSLACMERFCCCAQAHGAVQGVVQIGPLRGMRRSEVAGRYTLAWCQALAKAILQEA